MNLNGILRVTLGGGLTAVGILSAAGMPATVSASGPSASGSSTGNVAVNPVISLSGLTSSFTLTGDPNSTATVNSAVSMTVTTNAIAGYDVTVQAAAANLTGATSGNTDTIPVGDLLARDHTGGTFAALSSSTPLNVHGQSTRSAAAGDTVVNDYQANIPFVNADTYSATLDYVAAAR